MEGDVVHRIDSVDYVLRVREGPTGWFGMYFCKCCWKGGVKYDPQLPTVELALSDAKERAVQHHTTKHGKRDRNRDIESALWPFDTES